MHIKPLGRRVLIKQRKEEERTKGGLYIPESVKDSKKEGIVVEVGTTKDNQPLPLKKGDRILYGGYNSEEFEVEGETYVIIAFKDILAKIEGDN